MRSLKEKAIRNGIEEGGRIRKVIRLLFFVHWENTLKDPHADLATAETEIPDLFCSYRCTLETKRTTRLGACRFHPMPQDFIGDPDESTGLCYP
jgi:hypothetical protein